MPGAQVHHPDGGQAMLERGVRPALIGLGGDEHRHCLRGGRQVVEVRLLAPGVKAFPRTAIPAPLVLRPGLAGVAFNGLHRLFAHLQRPIDPQGSGRFPRVFTEVFTNIRKIWPTLKAYYCHFRPNTLLVPASMIHLFDRSLN